MKHLSHANRRNSGFSLMELLVASSVVAIVITSVCGVYFSVARAWEHQQGVARVSIAVESACTRLAQYISQAVSAQVVPRFASSDALAINLPLDSPYPGVYSPVWSRNRCQFRSGTWIIFYLSDSTGSYSRSGNILWAATMSWSDFPSSVSPDRGWSMYYDTNRGRVEDLKSLSFVVDSGGSRPMVVVTATASYSVGGAERDVSMTRTICLHNTN
ncbi:MAG: PulJ/GspJ family protein [Armatimonadota bacterium]